MTPLFLTNVMADLETTMQTEITMRYDSRARLAALYHTKEAAHAALMRLHDEQRELRAERARLEGRLRTLDQDDRGGSADPERRRLAARIAELDEATIDLQNRCELASAEWNAAARLVESCLEFARREGLPLPAQLADNGAVLGGMGAI